LLRLVGLWQEFQQANLAVKRLGDILDIPQEPHALSPSRENTGKGHIELVDVAFRYAEQQPWLYRGLNLDFKPGHLTVIMGPSGSGKSTLAKLLQAFYQPSEGSIRSTAATSATWQPTNCAPPSASYRRRPCCSRARSMTT